MEDRRVQNPCGIKKPINRLLIASRIVMSASAQLDLATM